MENNNQSEWWKDGIIYHIYPQSFKDTNNDGFGDLQGIIQKLDYLSGLGIDAIWLSPIYQSPMVDGGYDISDHKRIHPDYGTMDDFRKLLGEAHDRKIRIIMDLVLNHTSDRHPWFLESKSSKDNPKRDWYIWQPPKNGKRPNNWRTNFGKKAWQFDPHTGEYYYHSFFWEQADLNWRNTEVKKEMFSIITFWLNMGIDGFRLDVINLLFKDESFRNDTFLSLFSNKKVYCRNRPETYELLKDFRSLLNKYPDKTSVGEIYMPPPGDSKLATGFLGNGTDMLHMVFDFSLIFAVWKASVYYKIIRNYYKNIPANGWPCFFFSNHDIGRSVKRVKWVWNKYAKAKLHAVLLLTLKGTPFIYYGDEIGMENTDIPKHSIRDLYGKLFYPLYKGRDGSRTPMQWDDTPFAGFSVTEPFLPVNNNYTRINVATESKDNYSIYSIYKKLIALRKEYPALRSGDIDFFIKGRKNVLAYTRFNDNNRIAVFLNFGVCRKKISTKNMKSIHLLFSTHPDSRHINNYIHLKPYEGLIMEYTT